MGEEGRTKRVRVWVRIGAVRWETFSTNDRAYTYAPTLTRSWANSRSLPAVSTGIRTLPSFLNVL